MDLKTVVYNGKKVKLYPAYNCEKHAHDIEFRYNRCKNIMYDMENGDTEWIDDTYDKLEKLSDALDEIRSFEGNFYPMTYLPYPLYELAKETIAWAGLERGTHSGKAFADDEDLDLTQQVERGR